MAFLTALLHTVEAAAFQNRGSGGLDILFFWSEQQAECARYSPGLDYKCYLFPR